MSYYRPFTTSNRDDTRPDDSEDSDSSDDTDSSEESGFTDSTAQGLDDPRYAIIRAAGPSFTANQQLFYQAASSKNQIVMGYPYNDDDVYDPSTNFLTNIPYLPFTPANTSITSSLFAFTSANRDITAYPSSMYFTIKTPRTYKNITQIQFTNISFPNFLNAIPDASALFVEIANYVSSKYNFTFSNCYACLGNSGGGRGLTSSLNGGSFSELGRTNPAAPTTPLVHTFSLKGGVYDPGAMANEMDKQLNATPPFNLISYAEHRQLFLANGNANHLFNDPGKWYYSPITGTYVRNASKSLVIKDYLPHTRISAVQPTEREVFVAYFYPVLKAALLSTYDNKFLSFGDLSFETVQQRVLQAFEGIDSPLYYDVCYANLATLKSIRRVHTFEYYPINSYNYTYTSSDGQLAVAHTDLHPSLSREIQNYYETSKIQTGASLGYTGRDLTALQAKISTTGASVSTLTQQLQTALLEVGVPLYTYSQAQLATPSTPICLQTKKALNPQQMTESDDELIALTLGGTPSLSPPAAISRSFPAGFGWNTLQQLALDASNAAVAPRAFTVPYLAGLQALNQASGSGFSALYTSFLNLYSTNTGLATTATTIQSQGLALTSNYVNKKYGSVFPPTLLQNNAYLNGKGTGGVTFHSSKSIHYPSTPDTATNRALNSDSSSCCAYISSAIQNFYGCLPSEYVINTPFYKLGYGTQDILSFYSTNTYTSKIAQNDVYIQLNEQYSLNSMDIAGNEHLNVSNESAGQHKRIFGKILTRGSTAGEYTQTIVQLPAKFPISPLASLDHFTFNFLLDTMVPLSRLYPFSSVGTEWSGILQIDEQVGVFSTESAAPG